MLFDWENFSRPCHMRQPCMFWLQLGCALGVESLAQLFFGGGALTRRHENRRRRHHRRMSQGRPGWRRVGGRACLSSSKKHRRFLRGRGRNHGLFLSSQLFACPFGLRFVLLPKGDNALEVRKVSLCRKYPLRLFGWVLFRQKYVNIICQTGNTTCVVVL